MKARQKAQYQAELRKQMEEKKRAKEVRTGPHAWLWKHAPHSRSRLLREQEEQRRLEAEQRAEDERIERERQQIQEQHEREEREAKAKAEAKARVCGQRTHHFVELRCGAVG